MRQQGEPTPDQIERAAKAYYDATFDTDQGEGAEYGPYDEPWEEAPTSYKKGRTGQDGNRPASGVVP